jgi:pimeloyl-ACP methyl ester carboxylesterase
MADCLTDTAGEQCHRADVTAETAVPAWFRRTVSDRPLTTSILVGGVAVSVERWGGDRPPAIVLLHGAGAHALWWAHIAPLLVSSETSVLAIDFTGHGSSDRRARYSLDAWASEVRDVVRSLAGESPPVVVGHSLGGVVALRAASESGHGFAGVVLVDSLLRPRDERRQGNRERIASSPTKIYSSQNAAVAAFRPFPKPDKMLPYVAKHVAMSSLREQSGGYTWRFDPRIFARPDIEDLPVPLVPTVMVRPEHGLVDAEILARIDRRIVLAGVVQVRGAGHHAMLDAPVELAAAIEAGVALVRHSL